MRELMQLNVGACTAERAEIRAIRKRNGRPKVGRAAAGRAARAENPRNYCLLAKEPRDFTPRSAARAYEHSASSESRA